MPHRYVHFLNNLQETYYLWKLAGGDVLGEMTRHGLMVTRPPLLSLPKLVLAEGHAEGQGKERSSLYDPVIIRYSAHFLKSLNTAMAQFCFPTDLAWSSSGPAWPKSPRRTATRSCSKTATGRTSQTLAVVSITFLYGKSCIGRSYPTANPLLFSDTASTNAQIVGEGDETAALPLVIKEGDVKYQFKRIVLYRRLLQCYPFQRPRIWTEARVDSLPQVIFRLCI